METATDNFEPVAISSRRFVCRRLTTGGNRRELLPVEMRAERERYLDAFRLGLGVAALGLLAALTPTAAIGVGGWACSPVASLMILTVLYGGTGVWLGRRLTARLRDGQPLSVPLDQL